MKFFVTVLLALVLLTLESVVVKYLGMSVTRIDVTVAVIAFLALRASVTEAAISSFAIGYLLDLMSGRPTGLYTFLAVLVMLAGRLGSSFVDVRSAVSFAAYAMGLDVLHNLLALFFTWMTARGTTGVGFSFSALVIQMLLTALAALLLFPLFRRMDSGSDRHEVGLLR